LEYTFSLLAAAGVSEVIVNTCYLADRMHDRLRELDTSGLRIHTSFERKILGTAGGLKKAGGFLGNGTFILVNGDFLADIDLREVVGFHRTKGARATMVLRKDERAGVISVDEEGKIGSFLEPARPLPPEWIRTIFTGIHVLEPEVLRLIPAPVPWEINRQVYPDMLRRGWPVHGFIHPGYWREAGDPAGYLAANLDLLSGRAGGLGPRRRSGRLITTSGDECRPPVLIAEGGMLGPRAMLGPEAVIGREVRIGERAVVRRAVILEGTDIPDGTRVDGEIWSPEGRISVHDVYT
jgi:NDP-sugar pyrophosphorylase family protein